MFQSVFYYSIFYREKSFNASTNCYKFFSLIFKIIKKQKTSQCFTEVVVVTSTLVDSPHDIQHSTTWRTHLQRCYFSCPWIPHLQSLSFHACSLYSGLKNEKYASGESTLSWRTAIGRTDLRAKRPETDRFHISKRSQSRQLTRVCARKASTVFQTYQSIHSDL